MEKVNALRKEGRAAYLNYKNIVARKEMIFRYELTSLV